MGIHFRDVREILNILKDIKTYIFIQNKNDKLDSKLVVITAPHRQILETDGPRPTG